MSDHGNAPDPRTDIVGLYTFAAPGNGDRSVLVLLDTAKFMFFAIGPTAIQAVGALQAPVLVGPDDEAMGRRASAPPQRSLRAGRPRTSGRT